MEGKVKKSAILVAPGGKRKQGYVSKRGVGQFKKRK